MYMPADRISRLEEKTVNFSNVDNEKQRKKKRDLRALDCSCLKSLPGYRSFDRDVPSFL